MLNDRLSKDFYHPALVLASRMAEAGPCWIVPRAVGYETSWLRMLPDPSLQPPCYGLRPSHAAELKRWAPESSQ